MLRLFFDKLATYTCCQVHTTPVYRSGVGAVVGLPQHESLCSPSTEALGLWWGSAPGDRECALPLSTPKGMKERGKRLLGVRVGGVDGSEFARITHINNWANILFCIMVFDRRGEADRQVSATMGKLGSEHGPEALLSNHIEEKRLILQHLAWK